MRQATHRFSSLAFVIGMAGLPVYIHGLNILSMYRISLFTMGFIMFILRLIDVFQTLTWYYSFQNYTLWGSTNCSSCSSNVHWDDNVICNKKPIIAIIMVFYITFYGFTGFSFAYIRSYAQGLVNLGANGQYVWQDAEVGTTLGICVAILPTFSSFRRRWICILCNILCDGFGSPRICLASISCR